MLLIYIYLIGWYRACSTTIGMTGYQTTGQWIQGNNGANYGFCNTDR